MFHWGLGNRALQFFIECNVLCTLFYLISKCIIHDCIWIKRIDEALNPEASLSCVAVFIQQSCRSSPDSNLPSFRSTWLLCHVSPVLLKWCLKNWKTDRSNGWRLWYGLVMIIIYPVGGIVAIVRPLSFVTYCIISMHTKNTLDRLNFLLLLEINHNPEQRNSLNILR